MHDDSEFVEDLHFEHTRMSFWDHIEELRFHVWRAIIGFVIAMIAAIPLALYVTQFITAPVEAALQHFYDERAKKVAEGLKNGDPKLIDLNRPRLIHLTLSPQEGQAWAQAFGIQAPSLRDAEIQLPAQIRPVEISLLMSPVDSILHNRPALKTLSITEGILVYFKVAMYLGVVLASPWIFIQLWSFIAAGLYPNEKRMVNVYLPFSIALFLAGVALCEFVLIPYSVSYLLSFNEWMGLEPDLRLTEWMSFAVMLPLVFGCAFQTPLIMLFFNRLGVIPVEMYQEHRRMAMFGMACLSIVLAIVPDATNTIALMLPLWALYEVGILLCKMYPRATFTPRR